MMRTEILLNETSIDRYYLIVETLGNEKMKDKVCISLEKESVSTGKRDILFYAPVAKDRIKLIINSLLVVHGDDE